MAPPPSDRRPSRTGFESDSDPPPNDDDSPATRRELRQVVKRLDRIEPLRHQFADLQADFVDHRARTKADITGAVRAAVVEQLEPIQETVGKAHGILVEQEARAKIKAEETKDKESRRKNRVALIVGISPIAVALIAAWSAWVAMRAPQPQQPPQHHIEAK